MSPEQLGDIASFSDPGTLLSIIQGEGWTVENSLKELIRLAKGPHLVETVDEDGAKSFRMRTVKPELQLRAIKYLNDLIEDALEKSGLMIMAKKTISNNGESVTFSGHVVSSVLRGEDNQTQPSELVIDNGKENDNGNSKTTTDPGKSTGKESRKIKRVESREVSDSGKCQGEPDVSISTLHTSRKPEGKAAKQFGGVARRNLDGGEYVPPAEAHFV